MMFQQANSPPTYPTTLTRNLIFKTPSMCLNAMPQTRIFPRKPQNSKMIQFDIIMVKAFQCTDWQARERERERAGTVTTFTV
jgi:hypothetical protein